MSNKQVILTLEVVNTETGEVEACNVTTWNDCPKLAVIEIEKQVVQLLGNLVTYGEQLAIGASIEANFPVK